MSRQQKRYCYVVLLHGIQNYVVQECIPVGILPSGLMAVYLAMHAPLAMHMLTGTQVPP